LFRIFLLRGALVATPFVIWFAWRAWAVRNGRPMGATPWAWLTAAGALLAGLSLVATVAFQADNRGETYVPGQVQPDGTVTEGRFEQAAKP
jgi:type VI protein secretion system component VasK